MAPSQSGRARLSVRDRWLVGVKEWGIRPRRLMERRVTNRANIGAAQGAEWGPAARRTRAGRLVAKVENAKVVRVVTQLGEKVREIQAGATMVASVIMGSRSTTGGLNWSNKLRFMAIGGSLVGIVWGRGWGRRVGEERLWLW